MRAPIDPDRLVWLAAAFSGMQVGVATVLSRPLLAPLGPLPLAFWRYAIGVAVMLPLAWHGWHRLARDWQWRDAPRVAALGITQFAVLLALFNTGLQTVPAAQATLLFATMPTLSLLFGIWIGHERFTAIKAAALLLSLAGVAVTLGAGSGQLHAGIGEAMLLGSAVVGGLCSVLYRPYVQRYPALPLGVVAMSCTVVALAVVTGPTQIARVGNLSAGEWLALIVVGVSSGVAYFLWLWALRRRDASRVTIYLGLGPITAAVLGIVWLDEPVTGRLIAGTVMVIVALVAVGRIRSQR